MDLVRLLPGLHKPELKMSQMSSEPDDRTVVRSRSQSTPVATSALVLPTTAQTVTEGGLTSVTALPVGTRLFEFELTAVIGEGGFGIVYAAYDHSLDRSVAVKEYMPSSLAARTGGFTVEVRSQRYAETFEAARRSFINEARLLARFDHPSLVKVFRFWEANGTAYMAMPLYKGLTLKQRIKQMAGLPSEAWLVDLLRQLLDALEIIHRENCFHRDIAPDNILLVDNDRPVLLDFGAARRVIGDLTQSLTVILKPGYAPVEQYAEIPSMRQGPWTDIYALAAVMHYVLTGKPPEPSISRLMHDTVTPLAELVRSGFSLEFLEAIDAALKVRPEDRPQNVAAFRSLLNLASGQTSTVTTSRPASDVRDPARPAAGVTQPGAVTAAQAAGDVHDRTPATPADAPAEKGDITARKRSPMGSKVVFVVPVLAVAVAAVYLTQRADAPGPVITPAAVVNESKPDATVAPTVAPQSALSKPQAPAAVVPVAPPVITTPPSDAVPAAPDTSVPALPAAPAEWKAASPARVKPRERVVLPPIPRPSDNSSARGATDVSRAMQSEPSEKEGKADIPPVAKPTGEARVDDKLSDYLVQAQRNLARNDFRSAKQYADRALALDPGNARAEQIKQRAQVAEKAAFDSIKIE